MARSATRFHLYCPMRVERGPLCGVNETPNIDSDVELPDCLDCHRVSRDAGIECPICKEACNEHG